MDSRPNNHQQTIKILLPIIRQVVPRLIAADIVGVQPMNLMNDQYGNWVKWFAWYPVRLRSNSKRTWLKSIYRRKIIPGKSIFQMLDFKLIPSSLFTRTKIWLRRKFTFDPKYQYDNDFGILKDNEHG